MNQVSRKEFEDYMASYKPWFCEGFHNEPLSFLQKNENRFYSMLTNISPYLKSGVKVCDFGSFPGSFLRVLNDFSPGMEITSAGLLIDDEFKHSMDSINVDVLSVNLDPAHDGLPLYTDLPEYNIPKRNYFDIVIASEVFEHMINPVHLIWIASRILKPGGVIMVTTPNVANIRERLRFLFGNSPNVPVHESILDEKCGEWRPHYRLYTSAEVISTIENFDFHVVKSTYFHEMTSLTRTTLKSLIHMIPGFRHGQLQIAEKKLSTLCAKSSTGSPNGEL